MTQLEAATVAIISLLVAGLLAFCGVVYLQAQEIRRLDALIKRVDTLHNRLVLDEAQITGHARSLTQLEAWRRARLGGYDAGLTFAQRVEGNK